MNILKTLLVAAVFAGLCTTTAPAQLISYTFTTDNHGAPVAPTVADTTTTGGTDLQFGPGLSNTGVFGLFANLPVASTTATPPIVADTSLAAAVSDSAYFTFTVSPTSGNVLNLSDVSFVGGRFTEDSGSMTYELESSATGFGTAGANELGSFTVTGNYPTTNGSDISLSSSSFSTLFTPVTFRLYVYGSGTEAGFFDATSNGGSDGPILINGTTALAPEPGTFALLGLGLGALFLIARRRRTARE